MACDRRARNFVLLACHWLADRGTSALVDDGAIVHKAKRLRKHVDPYCEPALAPHVSIDRSRMNGDEAPFQAWRATDDSVDLRFYAFPGGYVEGSPWGSNCSWPLSFICNVRTVPIRPSAIEMQQDGIGPGLGQQLCTWEQASSRKNGRSHHCHVYLYNLQGAEYLAGSAYHAWCMACIGPNCSKSDDSMVYPRPEAYEMLTEQDYEMVMAAMDPYGNQTSMIRDIQLSSGKSIQGYWMDDGCKCYVSRRITGWKGKQKMGKVHPVRNKAELPVTWFKGLELVLDDGMPFKTMDRLEAVEHVNFCAQAMVACFALMAYICWSLFGLQRYVKVIHETGLATLIGYAVGYFKMVVAQDRQYIEFSFESMSFIVLPVVIFTAGFNLNGKSFFRHFPYIMFYGFFGTLIFFFGCFSLFRLANTMSDGGFTTTKKGVPFVFDTGTCLVLAAVLSCCDTVAPLTLINPATLPVLYAVVFGEAVLNDVVGVLLSAGLHHWKDAPHPFVLLYTVTWCSVASLFIGLTAGVLISWIWARSPSLQKGELQPVFLMFLMNYMCYLVAEMLELSAIFAIFVCALVCSHYAAESLSHEAQHFAREASEGLSYLCESGMFVYFGFASATYLSDLDRYPVCISAALYCTGVVVVVRPLVLTSLYFLKSILKGCRPLSVPFSNVFVVELCGCIRGTICYALIIKYVPSFQYRDNQDQLLVSTVLLVVNITTIFFGAVLPVAIRCLEPKERTSTADTAVGIGLSAMFFSEATARSPLDGMEKSLKFPNLSGETDTSTAEKIGSHITPRSAATLYTHPVSALPSIGSEGPSVLGSTFQRTSKPFGCPIEEEAGSGSRTTMRLSQMSWIEDTAEKWTAFDERFVMPWLRRRSGHPH